MINSPPGSPEQANLPMPAPKRRWERGRWLLEAARDGWTDRMDGCDPPPGAGPTTAHPSPLRLPKSRSPIGPRRLSPAPSQGGGSAARPALAIGRKIRQGGGKAGNSAGPAAGYALLLPTGQLGQERPPSIGQSPLLPHAHGRETEAPRRLQMWVLPPASPPGCRYRVPGTEAPCLSFPMLFRDHQTPMGRIPLAPPGLAGTTAS